jgi:hypothetical protein
VLVPGVVVELEADLVAVKAIARSMSLTSRTTILRVQSMVCSW